MIQKHFATNILQYSHLGVDILQQIFSESINHPFHLALTGGSSVLPIYKLLPSLTHSWKDIHLWWSDERLVPLDSHDSNYYQAQKAFIEKIDIAETQVHPVHTSLSPDQAASNYAHQISTIIPNASFELVLLGLGPDGHIASLFPNHSGLFVSSDSYVIPILDSPKPPPERITFTLNLLTRAQSILLFAKGAERVAVLEAALSAPQHTPHLPFTLLLHQHPNIHLLMCPDSE
jgi:6-phosphogluconolactonase